MAAHEVKADAVNICAEITLIPLLTVASMTALMLLVKYLAVKPQKFQ